MRAVTPEEAQHCMVRMSLWAKKPSRKPTSSTGAINRKSSFSERVYQPLQKWEVGLAGEPGLELASTPWCAQYMLRSFPYFPCCPRDFGTDPIDDYFQNLKVGAVLAYNDHDDLCPKLAVHKSVIHKKKSSILVMCERTDSRWSIVGIELHEKSRHFIHFILGSYSSKDETNEAFCIKKESNISIYDGCANWGDLNGV